MQLSEASQEVVRILGRQLSVVEINLIKRRIVDYFKTAGIEYKDNYETN